MKRSEINKALKELEAMCEKYHCYLPPFCHFTPEEWQHVEAAAWYFLSSLQHFISLCWSELVLRVGFIFRKS